MSIGCGRCWPRTLALASLLSLAVLIRWQMHRLAGVLARDSNWRRYWSRSCVDIRACVVRRLDDPDLTDGLNDLEHRLTACIDDDLWQGVDPRTFHLDKGHLVTPRDPNASGLCLTLGLDDPDRLTELKRLWPLCVLHGLEVSRSTAVSGDLEHTLANLGGVYHSFPVAENDRFRLAEFVDRTLKRPAVDYLAIADDRFIADLIPEFAQFGRIEQLDVAVCQLSILADKRQSPSGLVQLVRLLTLSSWLPLRVLRNRHDQLQLFFVNCRSLYCLDKFFVKCQ